MRRSPVRDLTLAAMVAALYAVLSYFSNIFGLAYGPIQFRFSEALCVLPIFLPAAIPGLAVGCLLANALTGAVVMDIVLGPVATLAGAVGTWLLRRHPRLAILPPILANVIIVPWVLRYGYGMPDAIWYMMLTVGAGEVISVGILGTALYEALRRRSSVLGAR